jgi:hypothetical protein
LPTLSPDALQLSRFETLSNHVSADSRGLSYIEELNHISTSPYLQARVANLAQFVLNSGDRELRQGEVVIISYN